MNKSLSRLSMAACVLSVGALSLVPAAAVAQDNGGGTASDVANKKIDLDLESSNLYYGLKLLFSQVKANFTIDESLKSLTVTAHLSQVPFRVALETLLKSTGTPLTYKVENGIYSVVPKVEEPGPVEEPSQPATPTAPVNGGYKYGIIRPNNMSAIDIVQAFGGHIVSVGYNPAAYGSGGMGGLGGGMGGFGGSGGFGGGGFGGGGLGGGYGGFGGSYGGSSYGGYSSGYGGFSFGGYGSGESGYRPGIGGGGGNSGGTGNPGSGGGSGRL